MLTDSAHIQAEDAAYWSRKQVRRGQAPIEPLYLQEDVEATANLLQVRRLRTPFDVLPGIRATYHEAGHMLGSAGVTLSIDTGRERPTRVTFTGDIGRPDMAILKDPAPLPECDYLICESTYGGRRNPASLGIGEKLAEVINDTAERGGKLIIPAFAVGRTQVLTYEFHRLIADRRIPSMPLVVDSPLASAATQVFKNHPEVYDSEARAFRTLRGTLLECGHCEYTQDVEASKALNGRPGPMIIISASGMCETGRILHHLKNNIESDRNTILIVGFQAAHTLGRRLVEGKRQVRIFGEMRQVRAPVRVLNGFSGHADAGELEAITRPLAGLVRHAFLVHGEMDQSEALAGTMRAAGFAQVTIPKPGETFPL
jgi:metallo-beta-lactamase family protein